MNMRLIPVILTLIILFAFLSMPIMKVRADSNTFSVWVATDTHVNDGSYDQNWYHAINDSKNLNFDIAIVGGDTVNSIGEGNEGLWPQELSRWRNITETSNHPYPDFYPITGNHEVQSVNKWNGTGGWNAWNTTMDVLNNSGRTYPADNGKNNAHFTIQVGNILFVCFGPDSDANVSYDAPNHYANDYSEQFGWWKSIVENNTDKNIICVTHHSLYGSGLTSPSWGPYIDGGADEYTNWLDNHTDHSIVAWICGHEHYVSSDVRKSVHWNITHIRASAVDKASTGHGGEESHSYLFTFANGSKTVNVGDFDHDTSSWDPSGNPGNFTFELKYPFSLSASPASPSVIDSANFTMEATVFQNETPSPSLTLLDSKTFVMSAVVWNESSNNGSGFIITPSNTPYYILAGMAVFFPFLGLIIKKHGG